MKIIFLIFSVSFCTLMSQLLLKKGMMKLSIDPGTQQFGLYFLSQAFQSLFVWSSLFLQGIGYCLWMFVISKQKLGVAFGFSGAFFYILLPLMTWMIYGEKLSGFQWVGLLFITAGIAFMLLK